MWFPMIRHGDSVIEARHCGDRWHFRRRTTAVKVTGYVVTRRSEPTTGLGWLLDEGGPGLIEGLHSAARTVMRGARDYALRERRTSWWFDAVDHVSSEKMIARGEPPEELRLPWNAHIVHHHELLRAWHARSVGLLPLVDLEALLLAGTVGAEVDHAWERYVQLLDEIMRGGLPGPAELVARFEMNALRAGPAASPLSASLVRDAWHWGLALGAEDTNALPPEIGAELAWRHASCLTERHRAALGDDVVMLALALRHVSDPREPFAVLVHGRCEIHARWRLGVWEWSAFYKAQAPGFWRRGELTALLRSDLLNVGPPTYLHPTVAPLVRDAFELAACKLDRPHADEAIWHELLERADVGQIVDRLARDDQDAQ